MGTSLSAPAASAAADAVVRRLDGGRILVYPQGGGPLAVFRLGSPCARPATDGVAAFIAPDPAPVTEAGTPVRYEALTADDRLVFAGDVGSDLLIAPAGRVLVPGDLLIVNSLTYTQPRA